MAYSCCDFTDDVFAELHRVGAITEVEFKDENLADNASLQADYAMNGIARLVEVRDAARQAKRFMQELLDSVETLTGIAERHGARTLADLMYLHGAIVNSGFIDHYPDESAVLEIARGLPSGEQWAKYIKVEYMASAAKPQFYFCGICGSHHAIEFDGDCRESSTRFGPADLDAKYGADGWEEVAMPP